MRWHVGMTIGLLTGIGAGFLVTRVSPDLPALDRRLARAEVGMPRDRASIRGSRLLRSLEGDALRREAGLTEPSDSRRRRGSGAPERGVFEPHNDALEIVFTPGHLPDDALEHGKGRLTLRFVDAATLAPVVGSTYLTLWRLGVPGDDRFGPGDEMRLAAAADGGVVHVDDLPAGTYRVQCNDQAYLSDHPPPFWFDGADGEITVRLSMPRAFATTARVFTLDGSEPRSVVRERGISCSLDAGRREAEWVNPREPVGPWELPSQGRMIACGGADDAPQRIERRMDAFFLDDVRQASRAWSSTRRTHLFEEGCAPIYVGVPTKELVGPVVAVAPLVPLDRIAADVRLPDGRTLAEAGVSYSAVAIARLIHPGEREQPEDLWRDVPVEVKVRGEKRRVTIEWRAGPPGGPAVITLVDGQ